MSSCNCSGSHPHRLPRGVSRRDVLRYALGGAGIAALGPVVSGRIPQAFGAPQGNKILVMINMDGGCDTLNSVIPDLASYYTRRPSIGVPQANSLPLTGGPSPTTLYRFHPEMDQLKGLWDAGDVAIVQKVGYPDENLSHFESQDIYSNGVRQEFAPLGIPQSGWIARYAQLYAPTPMGAVSIGMGRPTSFVGGSSNPLQVGNLSSFKFNNDSGFTQNQNYRLQIIQQVLAGATTVGTPGEVRSAVDQAHALSGQIQTALSGYNTYLATSGITYQSQTISRNLKDVAALIHGGFETRVFYTGYGGFDLHGDEGAVTGNHATLMQRLDDAIGSFAADMKNLGQWDNIVIAVFTEFGRRNYENGSFGTDHGAAFTMLLAGGGVNGGSYAAGAAGDVSDANLNDEYLTYAVDFRDVYREIVGDHLGSNPAPVFPEAQPKNIVLGIA